MGQSVRVDYYRGGTSEMELIQGAINAVFKLEETVEATPFYGYRTARKNVPSGGILYSNPHTANMGVLTQWTGQPMSYIMDTIDMCSPVALRRMGFGTWGCTRIDIAIDVLDGDIEPYQVMDKKKAGRAKTSLRKWNENKAEKHGEGHTVYAGSMKSERFVRIYDKSAESGVKGKWTRVEMVFQEDRALQVWKQLQHINDNNALMNFAKSLLKSILDFPEWRQWQKAFGSESVHEWEEIPRTDADKWQWLTTQVAPTFLADRHLNGEYALLNAFVAYVREQYEHEGSDSLE